MQDVNADATKKAILTNGTNKLGIPYQDWIDEYLALKSICDNIAASTINNDNQINTAADYYLSNVPELVSLWPNG
jgi:hypothetical protein